MKFEGTYGDYEKYDDQVQPVNVSKGSGFSVSPGVIDTTERDQNRELLLKAASAPLGAEGGSLASTMAGKITAPLATAGSNMASGIGTALTNASGVGSALSGVGSAVTAGLGSIGGAAMTAMPWAAGLYGLGKVFKMWNDGTPEVKGNVPRLPADEGTAIEQNLFNRSRFRGGTHKVAGIDPQKYSIGGEVKFNPYAKAAEAGRQVQKDIKAREVSRMLNNNASRFRGSPKFERAPVVQDKAGNWVWEGGKPYRESPAPTSSWWDILSKMALRKLPYAGMLYPTQLADGTLTDEQFDAVTPTNLRGFEAPSVNEVPPTIGNAKFVNSPLHLKTNMGSDLFNQDIKDNQQMSNRMLKNMRDDELHQAKLSSMARDENRKDKLNDINIWNKMNN